MTMPTKLLLASSSSYRRSLLERLGLEFQSQSPDIDESPIPNESPKDLVKRLSLGKAKALASDYPDHLIIASDQVAQFGQKILGKPHTVEKAIGQLSSFNGQSVTFHTGLCLLNTRTGNYQLDTVPFTVHFRELSEQQIRFYINEERPLDCAGSFMCEGLGITLFKKMEGDDPNSLIGLPLIRLTEMLNNEGVDPLNPYTH
ncbi:septum formation inhibitor Maf [Endozoicomonas sp. OPT23]|uniref:Maf family protein n=1 Tax=Endozoicomonas sp. OPT23 TaxID=2072845 RepID=UPI00129B23E6|nr:septum formation inhibitor Maf [Endozoicomonas sp. OPT23]